MEVTTKLKLLNQSYKYHYKEWKKSKKSRYLLIAKDALCRMNKIMKALNNQDH